MTYPPEDKLLSGVHAGSTYHELPQSRPRRPARDQRAGGPRAGCRERRLRPVAPADLRLRRQRPGAAPAAVEAATRNRSAGAGRRATGSSSGSAAARSRSTTRRRSPTASSSSSPARPCASPRRSARSPWSGPKGASAGQALPSRATCSASEPDRVGGRAQRRRGENRRMTTTSPAALGFSARTTRPHRPLPRRALCRPRTPPVRTARGGARRPRRAPERARPCIARAPAAARRGHDLSHLFDDQADHQRRLHDAGRGRQGRDRRPGAPLDPGLARPGGLSLGRSGAFVTRPVEAPMRIIDLLRHTSGLTYGFQLRTSVDAAYRTRQASTPSRAESARGLRSTPSAELPLEFSPGSGLELFGLDRRARLPRRPDLGHAVRRVRAHPDPAAARDGRHRFPRDRRQGRALRRLPREVALEAASAPAADARLPERRRPAPSGGGGLVSTAGRLPALLRDAAPAAACSATSACSGRRRWP